MRDRIFYEGGFSTDEGLASLFAMITGWQAEHPDLSVYEVKVWQIQLPPSECKATIRFTDKGRTENKEVNLNNGRDNTRSGQ